MYITKQKRSQDQGWYLLSAHLQVPFQHARSIRCNLIMHILSIIGYIFQPVNLFFHSWVCDSLLLSIIQHCIDTVVVFSTSSALHHQASMDRTQGPREKPSCRIKPGETETELLLQVQARPLPFLFLLIKERNILSRKRLA